MKGERERDIWGGVFSELKGIDATSTGMEKSYVLESIVMNWFDTSPCRVLATWLLSQTRDGTDTR